MDSTVMKLQLYKGTVLIHVIRVIIIQSRNSLI